MKRRLSTIILVAIAITLVLTACTPGTTGSTKTNGEVDSTASSSKSPVKITYFNTSAEVNTMFEDMFKRYK